MQQRTAVAKFYNSCLFNPLDYSLLQSNRFDPIGFVNSGGGDTESAPDSEEPATVVLYSFKIDLLELRGV